MADIAIPVVPAEQAFAHSGGDEKGFTKARKPLFRNGPSTEFLHGLNVASSHVQVRMGFLRKVYGIVCTQLALTFIVAAIIQSSTSITSFVQHSSGMMMVSFVVAMASLIAVIVKRKEHPTNMYLLAVFTVAEAYTVGVFVTFYELSSVMQALFLTAAVTLGLTLYAFQTTHDFTGMGGFLITSLFALIGIGFIQVFMPFNTTMDLLYSLGGVVLFSLFLLYDTQMLMKKHTPDDYVLCAIDLYLDILNIFLHILRAMGNKK